VGPTCQRQPTLHALAPSLPLLGGANLSAQTSLARAPPSLYVAGPPHQRCEPFVRALARSHFMWASLVSSIFPATAADPHLRTHCGDRTCRLPMRPSSFLSPAHVACPRLPSLALYRRRLCSPKILACCAGRLARQKPRRAPSRGEELAPVLGFSQFHLVLANSALPKFSRVGLPHFFVDWLI
jgi:hypothetical protein